MTHPTDTTQRLADLGDALLAATTAELRTERAVADAPARQARPRRRRRTLVAAALALVAVPGVAVAAGALTSEEEVARGLPGGTVALLGSDPTCTTVEAGVAFDCTLAKAPSGDLGTGGWARAVELTVGDDGRINGGCRSQNAAGTRWSCYLGAEAVRQGTVSPAPTGPLPKPLPGESQAAPAWLGAPSAGPGVG